MGFGDYDWNSKFNIWSLRYRFKVQDLGVWVRVRRSCVTVCLDVSWYVSVNIYIVPLEKAPFLMT